MPSSGFRPPLSDGSDCWLYRGLLATVAPTPMGHEYCSIVEDVRSVVRSVKPGPSVIGSLFRFRQHMSALPRGVPDILPPGSLLADVPMEDVARAVKELIKQGRVNGDGLRHMRVHGIHAIEEMAQQRVASKLSAYWDFLTQLRDFGRVHADAWLAGAGPKIDCQHRA